MKLGGNKLFLAAMRRFNCGYGNKKARRSQATAPVYNDWIEFISYLAVNS